MSYAGFTKTSYGAQGGEDSGGFFADGSQQGSQGAGGSSYQDESLRPVTILQVLNAEEAYSGADFKIDGSAVTQVTFVGQVRSVNPQQTNITYKIDDGTGQIEVKKWIDADKQDEPEPDFELDSYVRVWGRLKSFSTKRHVSAHVIRSVTDANEIHYHLLEATYVHLFFTKSPLQDQAGGGGANAGGLFVGGGGGGAVGAGALASDNRLSDCSALEKKIFNFISKTPCGNEGININIICSSTGMLARDVRAGTEELLSKGLIYTTVDDDTWSPLEF